MKRFFKSLLAVLLLGPILFTLAACQNDYEIVQKWSDSDVIVN